MANHAYVETQRDMTPQGIMSLFEELNSSLFHGKLTVQFTADNEDGKPLWDIAWLEDDIEWAGRLCWLNNSNSFEMRHGGGPSLAWWIDHAICNAVAVTFDGLQRDDAFDDHKKWPGVAGKYDSLAKYMYDSRGGNVPDNLLSYLSTDLPPSIRDTTLLEVRQLRGKGQQSVGD
jgi:hypothetical protein